MGDSFREWAIASTEWGETLLQLGASWDTFRGDQEVVLSDLVEGGIPRLAARSIFNLASEAIRRKNAPLAVFWDFESFPVPDRLHCSDVVEQIKGKLSHFGALTQFRCYLRPSSDNSLNGKERVDILAAGCFPTVSAFPSCSTEDMIVVDAMKFAYTHMEYATLCIIANHSRMMYLLSALQQKCWRTVIVSSTSAADSLPSHWSTISLEWNEIISDLFSEEVLGHPPGFGRLSAESGGASTSASSAHASDERSRITCDMSTSTHRGDSSLGVEAETIRNGLVPVAFPPLFNSGIANGLACRSSSTDADSSWVPVSGRLKKDRDNAIPSRWIPISEGSPVPLQDLPLEKMMAQVKSKPFVLFLRWTYCKKNLPEWLPQQRCYIIKDKFGMILMFRSREDVESCASEYGCLRKGVLVDWQVVVGKHFSRPCSICEANFPGESMIAASNRHDKFYCRDCYDWGTPSEKAAAFLAVTATMHFFEANDDILVADGILRKALVGQHPKCMSRELATLWIEGAIRQKFIVQVKLSGAKAKMLCLPDLESYVTSNDVSDTVKTFEEEIFVTELLLKTKDGWINREDVIASLKNKFASMQTPTQRFKLFENGRLHGRFFLVKSPLAQLVALHEESAILELDRQQMLQQLTLPGQNDCGSLQNYKI